MSFIGEIVEVIGKEAVEGGAEAGAEGTAEVSQASKVVDEALVQNKEINIDLAGKSEVAEPNVKIEADVEDGIKDAEKEVKDLVEKIENDAPNAVEEAEALEGTWKTKFQNVWGGAKTFGKFVGVEALKGALFYAGMKAIEAAWVKLFPPHQPGGEAGGQAGVTKAPVDDDRVKIIKTINKAGEIIQSALDSWSNWQGAHYNSREKYGDVVVSGLHIQLFQVLQSGIAEAGETRDKMAPLLTKAKNEKTLESAKALLTADIAYAKSVVDLADQIRSSMKSMLDAGLPGKYAELQSAYDMLVAASV
ncbi:hypothetical protein ABW19_dt0208590 [Dactylella cylindrospora]|nr:hypothetical protein ABW19_dt0208590 [Dactylella cylindrospora]